MKTLHIKSVRINACYKIARFKSSRNGNQPHVMVMILFSLQKLYFHLYLQLVNRNDFELERREHT